MPRVTDRQKHRDSDNTLAHGLLHRPSSPLRHSSTQPPSRRSLRQLPPLANTNPTIVRISTPRIRSFDDTLAATPFYTSTSATAVLALAMGLVAALIVTRNARCITDDIG